MSDTRNQILLHLSQGDVISGNQLAEYCGVSRAAIWKQIEGLRADGLAIDVVASRGYQIAGGLNLLGAEEITTAIDVPVTLLQETPSTNDWLMSRLPELSGQPHVCLSERQTAGRGTRGRAWESPLGSNIYCSIYQRFSKAPFELGGLSLAVAVTLVDELQELGVLPLHIKWPNDLYHSGGKLGGILIEMSAEANGPSDLVIGVGINVGMPQTLRQQIDQDVSDIHDIADAETSRSKIAIGVIRALITACDQFEQEGFAGFMDRWREYDMTEGQQVKILTGKQEIHGLACGVNEQGMIRIETEQGMTTYSSGDVSLRVS